MDRETMLAIARIARIRADEYEADKSGPVAKNWGAVDALRQFAGELESSAGPDASGNR
jgi:hypothetical protein